MTGQAVVEQEKNIPYTEVTDAYIECLFGIAQQKKKRKDRENKKAFIWFTSVFILLCTLSILFCVSSHQFNFLGALIPISIMLSGIITAEILQATSDDLRLVVVSESIHSTQHEISYGAKLKIKEARDAKVPFTGIFLAYPSYAPKDPVIYGEYNKKKYLIYAWNIDKDMANVAGM